MTAMLVASAATMVLVVYGFGLRSEPPEGPAVARAFHSLTSRESILPMGVAGGLMLSGHISGPIIGNVLEEMAPIVVLILAFAVISGGIERSGFFRYVTARALANCRGSVNRLVISIFMLTCALTYFLSNDIVILIMTPIMLEICQKTGLRERRIILLISCFIAANTLSMGLLFGSPTNIIVAVATETGFIQYLTLMALPTLMAVTTSLLVICMTMYLTGRRDARSLAYLHQYIPQPEFHHGMTLWLAGFALAVAGYSLRLALGLSFHWVSVPVLLLAGYGVSVTNARGMTLGSPSAQEVADVLANLPLCIIGFAISFFMVAFALAGEIPVEAFIAWLNGLPYFLQTAVTMLLTSALVNTINDLPSAATISLLLTEADNTLITQASLSALNIGCYLTPIGALAGIIFFHMLRKDAERLGTGMPTPLHLLRIGGINFIVVTLVTCTTIPGYHAAVSLAQRGVLPTAMAETEAAISISIGATVLIAVLSILAVLLRVMLRRKPLEE